MSRAAVRDPANRPMISDLEHMERVCRLRTELLECERLERTVRQRVEALEANQRGAGGAASGGDKEGDGVDNGVGVSVDDGFDGGFDEDSSDLEHNGRRLHRCGTWGCILPDKHPGLHSFAVPPSRRLCSQPLRFGWALPPTPPAAQQPSAVANRAAAAAMMAAECEADAAEADAAGISFEDGEGDGSEEDDFGDEAQDSDDDGAPRLAGRVLTSDGVPLLPGKRAFTRSSAGLEKKYSMNDPWHTMCCPDGTLMFENVEIRMGNSKRRGFLKVAERVHRMLEKGTSAYPDLESPPSSQPSNIRNAYGWPTKKIQRGPLIPVDSNYRGSGSTLFVLYERCETARRADGQAMKASCGRSGCPICRLPEDQQPQEHSIFFDDAIYWWNCARGKCMAAGCRRTLCFYRSPAEKAARIANGETPMGDIWTLQRDDNRINHVPSNIIGVLCHSCNSTISRERCASNAKGGILSNSLHAQ